MGLDRTYQALPEPCELLERAKVDPDLGEIVQFAYSALRAPDDFFRYPDDDHKSFHALILNLRANHPGIEKRSYDLNRRQDILLYLLSEDRRRGLFIGSGATDIGSKIIDGASSLPAHMRASQGVPMRYSSARHVQEFTRYLENIISADLRQFYHPALMDEDGVYKFHADYPEQQWQYICQAFEGLKAFYQEVAAHYEGILVVTD